MFDRRISRIVTGSSLCVIREIAARPAPMDNGLKRIEGTAAMRVLPNNFGWNPIETAPLDEDVSLEVTDRQGSRYRLPYRCSSPRPAGSARAKERRSDAGEVEAAPCRAMEAMTSRPSPRARQDPRRES